MAIFLFHSQKDAKVYAVTNDLTGANLPSGFAPWHPQSGQVIVAGVDLAAGGQSPDVARALERYGYYLATAPVTATRKARPSVLE